jgi:osmotically-inducible protein OsmY
MGDVSRARGEPTAYLVARVREALAHDHDVAALDNQVRIVERDVFLTGCVQSPERRAAAEAVVRSEAPDLVVHNQLDVTEVGPPDGREEIR